MMDKEVIEYIQEQEKMFEKGEDWRTILKDKDVVVRGRALIFSETAIFLEMVEWWHCKDDPVLFAVTAGALQGVADSSRKALKTDSAKILVVSRQKESQILVEVLMTAARTTYSKKKTLTSMAAIIRSTALQWEEGRTTALICEDFRSCR